MSRFTFLHAADLHLGSPLAGLASRNPELAARFMAAGRGAFSALVDHAIATKPAFLLIAGDIFDGEWADHTIGLFFAREVSRLERENIPVAYVRGNHDAESVVRKAITLPASTIAFPSRAAATHRLEAMRVALHGRSFPDRTVPDDFVSGYPDPLPGWFNIGLLHTSCGGHPNHDTYAPCTPAQLAAKNYEYWALGHVHDYVEVSRDPPIIYPGNLQGRSVKECGPKGAVAVEVADGHVTGLSRVVLDRARFATLDLVLDEHPDEAAVLAAVSAALHPHVAQGEGRPIALRITLRGATSLHDALAGDLERLEAELQAAAHRLHEDVWLERVRVRTTRPARPAASGVGLLDPAALLADIDRDEGFRERARAVIAEIGAKLPGGMAAGDEGALGEDLDQLLAEAEATVMARLSGRCG